MKRRVIVTHAAEADIDRLWKFLVERDPAAAIRAVETIRSALSSLDILAERGRPSPHADYRELPVPFGRRAYIVRYRLDDQTVLITRVHHSHEDRR